MLLIEDFLAIHHASIDIFGGSKGIRDLGMLESAIARPFQTFGGNDLYPSAIEKAEHFAKGLSSTIHL